MQVTYILFAVFFIWFLVLTFFLIKIFLFFRGLSKGLERKNLMDIITKILDTEKGNRKSINSIRKDFEIFEEKSHSNIQKVGLIKFNPFTEMGGDQSFSLTLLDFDDNGVIITGLHMRDRTRLYLKSVVKGKSEVELSKEEEKSLKVAQKSK